jgi:hypothetical protein
MIGRLALTLGALGFCGCVVYHDGGTTESVYESRAVERDAAKEVNVHLTMGAGRLRVGSGTSKLMQAYFTYNRPAWKPEMRYGSGDLTIIQPSTHNMRMGNHKYEWDLRFAQDVPLNFHVKFGAGEGELDLGSLTLTNVDVEMGVGSLKLDLRGVPKHDYRVNIEGGIGEATVLLPSSVGVFAEAEGGIGEIKARGLNKRGDHWENEAYSGTGPKIHLTAHGGIGSIVLTSE